MDDLIKLLRKYKLSIASIHLLSDCFRGNKYDNVEEVIESIEDLIKQLNEIKESIERKIYEDKNG